MDTTRRKEEAISISVRWMVREHMAEVLQIERERCKNPWTEQDLLNCLNHENHLGMVAEKNGRVAGFVIYKAYQSNIYILNLAVLNYNEIGIPIVEALIEKLLVSQHPSYYPHRNRIIIHIHERDLEGQMFLQKNRFRATHILKGDHKESGEDVYVMQYRLYDAQGTNRISKHFKNSFNM